MAISRVCVIGAGTIGSLFAGHLASVCEAHLRGRYCVEVIDLLLHPELAAADQIVALPTLVRRLPAPVRKVIGDLSDLERVLVGLELRAPGPAALR